MLILNYSHLVSTCYNVSDNSECDVMKFYKDVDEMKKANEELRTETVIELYKEEKIIRKEKKKKIVICIVILAIIISFKLFLGTLYVGLPFPYYKNRFYEVTLNNINLTVSVLETKTTPLIPYLFNMKTYSYNVFSGDDVSSVANVKKGDTYVINIKSYRCLGQLNNRIVQVGCKNNIEKVVKESVNDTSYTLYIRGTSKYDTVLYDGRFINDISEYLTKKGNYYVEIRGKYPSVKSEISFWINVVE